MPQAVREPRFANELASYLDARTEGRGISFALVLWLDGQQADGAAVCVLAPPRCAPDVEAALETGIAVLGT